MTRGSADWASSRHMRCSAGASFDHQIMAALASLGMASLSVARCILSRRRSMARADGTEGSGSRAPSVPQGRLAENRQRLFWGLFGEWWSPKVPKNPQTARFVLLLPIRHRVTKTLKLLG